MNHPAISHYQIIKRLGAGGMGEIYLAEDSLLDRRVAIKFLPLDSVADDQAKRRLVREAKAAARLDHPNICSIYEVAEENGTSFIVMQYIEGETLAGRMQKKPLELGEILDVTVQLADALAEAHSHGIIHRDIKPANIMLTARGQVKVLDFGLATVVPGRSSPESEAETQSLLTGPGMIVGTVAYMSPEQVRGEPIDARSDIFSFGVVLFEMVSGRNPFQAESAGATMSSILTKDPAPLARYASQVPDELQRIVRKALSKDKEGRYQGIKDLLIDLSRLKQKLEIEAEIERTALPEERGAGDEPKPSDGRQVAATEPSAATRKTDRQLGAVSHASVTRRTSSVEYVVSEIKRHKRGAALFGAALVLLLGGVTYGLYRFLRQPKPAAVPFQTTKVTKLTATGKAKDAVISPDGNYVVYVEKEAEQQSLWVMQVATGSSIQIVPPAPVVYWGLTFANDSNHVYYVKMELSNGIWVLYRVPSLGGASKRLIEPLDSAVTFSPDGQRFAFVRAHVTEKGLEPRLMLANVDGTGERTLRTRTLPDAFAADGVVRIAWSPDGKIIACPAVGNDADGEYYSSVVGVSVEDGSETPLTAQRWKGVTQVAWLSGGSGLAVLAVEQGHELSSQQLWHLSYPGGEVRRITNDLNAYASVSLTRNSDALVTVQSNRTSSIWIAPKGDPGRAKQITSGTRDGKPSWTPDGRIVYQSMASGQSDIWIVEADGSNQTRLTHEGWNIGPTVSRDGRYIIFRSTRAGPSDIWRMDIDGGNPKQLTDGEFTGAVDISPDGRWVVYRSDERLCKVPIDGGDPVQLTKLHVNLPRVSPDGKHIACYYWDEHAIPPHGVMILPFAGGQPTKRLKIFSSSYDAFFLDWTPDGRALMYIHLSNIWSQPVDGGDPVQLTAFQGDQLFDFEYSPDRNWLAVARGRVTDDVVLIADSK